MTKIAIRDDDTSFWTDVEILDRTVGKLWRAGAPVSLAIVPNSVQFESPWDRTLFEQGATRRALGENTPLTEYLRDLIREGRVTPMLHGIDHRYAFLDGKGEVEILCGRLADHPKFGKARLVGEFGWKEAAPLGDELRCWLAYLNDTLGYNIRIFVPPSNTVSRGNAREIYAAGLDICGAIATRRFNRPVSAAAIKNYVVCALWRIFHGAPYPDALRYGARLDRPAHAAPTPEKLKALSQLFKSKLRESDLIIATHWYDFERNPGLAEEILRFIDQTQREPSSVEATFLA